MTELEILRNTGQNRIDQLMNSQPSSPEIENRHNDYGDYEDYEEDIVPSPRVNELSVFCYCCSCGTTVNDVRRIERGPRETSSRVLCEQ